MVTEIVKQVLELEAAVKDGATEVIERTIGDVQFLANQMEFDDYRVGGSLFDAGYVRGVLTSLKGFVNKRNSTDLERDQMFARKECYKLRMYVERSWQPVTLEKLRV